MRSSNSARMNKFDFTTEKIGSVHKTVFEIVAPRNVDNWIQLLTRRWHIKSSSRSVKTVCTNIFAKKMQLPILLFYIN